LFSKTFTLTQAIMNKNDFAILFEDDDIVLINKPSGVSVTADRSGADDVLRVLKRQLSPAEPLRLIHRLDKETSGILLIAKHRDAQSRYSRLFAKRLVKKLYLAIVKGPVLKEAGSIKDPIARSRRNPQAMHIHPRLGKPAHTAWQRLADFGGLALLAVQTVTGRTHQIRVHCAHRGMPLAIDAMYGETTPLVLSAFKRRYRPKPDRDEPVMIDRLTLHAYQLALPIGADENQKYRTFVAVPDKNFLSTIKLLAKHTGPSKYVSAFEDPKILERIIAGQPLEFPLP
jgi:RluA family pseudouridine synthase